MTLYWLLTIAVTISGHVAADHAGPYKGLLACEAAAAQAEQALSSPGVAMVRAVCTSESKRPLTWNGKALPR